MNLKTESNQKESIPWKIKKHEQIAGVIECLNGNGDRFTEQRKTWQQVLKYLQ